MDLGHGIAKRLLSGELPRRWVHVRAVAAKAVRIAGIFDPDDQAVLVGAAWLHDIGYASPLVQTGFHPLDGARWLRAQGFEVRVTALVAHHSCALIEADERGLGDQLAAEFAHEASAVSDALWFVDMTTGPDGQDSEVTDRLNEIRDRYGPGAVVTRFIDRAEPSLVVAVRRTEERLRRAGVAQRT